MSEGSNLPREPIKNKSWLHSEPAARQIRQLADPDFIQIIENAKREIVERTRRVLTYSSESEDESPNHVTVEREFEFNDIDNSILPNIKNELNESERKRRHNRRPSDISHHSEYGEFSLTSYDSSVFDPDSDNEKDCESSILDSNSDELETMKKSDATMQPVATPADINKEIGRLFQEMSQHPTEGEVFEPRPGTSRAAGISEQSQRNSSRDPLATILDRLDVMQSQINSLGGNDRRHRESHPPTYQHLTFFTGDTESEKRIEAARSMIPTFDGINEERLKGFLKACRYAYRKVYEDEEADLTQAIICTKLTERALIEVENRDITTFGQLKETLEACYPTKKTKTQLQREFNNLRQRNGEDARAYGHRVERLATDLFEVTTEGKGLSSAEKRTIQDYIKSEALTNYQIGLNTGLQTIVRSRAPATLVEAVSEAVAEERIQGRAGYHARSTDSRGTVFRPTESRGYSEGSTSRMPYKPASCLKCGKIGHLGRDCRNSRYATRFHLPKPEGNPRVYSTQKYCSYCRKNGHTREECWNLPEQARYTFAKSKEPDKACNVAGFLPVTALRASEICVR